ncbi:MAG: hypothetical protein KME26_15080 [Oscillatoria princeps RMCB-10]|jgi:hypothetical protein|nr:hypothetical protein [Oscillatoria princeps RMCB-10]
MSDGKREYKSGMLPGEAPIRRVDAKDAKKGIARALGFSKKNVKLSLFPFLGALGVLAVYFKIITQVSGIAN